MAAGAVVGAVDRFHSGVRPHVLQGVDYLQAHHPQEQGGQGEGSKYLLHQ